MGLFDINTNLQTPQTLGGSTAPTPVSSATPGLNSGVASGLSFDAGGNAMQNGAPIPPTPTQAPGVTTQNQTTANLLLPQAQPAQTQQPQSNTPPAGSSNLGPGSQGQDVTNLQNYLIQHGYLTADQVAGGEGIYGPKTTAAVAQMQKDMGMTSGASSYGQQAQDAIGQKYQGMFNSSSGAPPNNAAEAGTALDQMSQTSSDPVFGSMAATLAPIMQSLGQVLQNINNPALTAQSLQSEYTQLATNAGLPDLQASMLNDVRIMNGTEDDIRDEITKGGGFATDSQVQAMSAARNKVITKQYNVLATQYQAASTNIQNMMQYATQDQSTQLQRDNLTANITQSMASIEAQMMQMGMTMQNNARSAVQYNVTQMGYTGLAQSAGGNPQMLGYYENTLGLAPGTLSNPDSLAAMDTYKNQQLQINNYRAAIAAYSAGYGGGGGIGGSGAGGGVPGTTQPGQVGVSPVDASTLNRPSWVNNNVPLTLSSEQMGQYMDSNKAASIDPGTNNIVAPGIGYYLQQSDGSYVLNSALPSTTDQQYNSIKQTISSAQPFSGSPRVTGQWTTATNKELSAFKDLGTYKVLSTVAPYMANIRAAQTNPGSISDLELLDSYVRLSKGGTGQVTGDQVDIALKGASIADSASVLEQKLQNGGVLSQNQRDQLVQLASQVYNENANDYKKIYVAATQGLQSQGIPVPFWSNLPDLNSLLDPNS